MFKCLIDIDNCFEEIDKLQSSDHEDLTNHKRKHRRDMIMGVCPNTSRAILEISIELNIEEKHGGNIDLIALAFFQKFHHKEAQLGPFRYSQFHFLICQHNFQDAFNPIPYYEI